MLKWAPYVFVRLTCYLVTGILTAIYVPVSATSYRWLQITFFVLATIYSVIYGLLNTSWKGRKLNTLTGLLAASIVFSAGILITYQRTQTNKPDHLLHQAAAVKYYSGIIVSEVTSTAKTNKAQLEVRQIFIDNHWQEASGKVLLYLNTKISKPRYGDKLFIKNSPQRVPAPANPYEFNYRNYLQLQQIYHQHFIKDGDAVVYGYQPPWRLMALSIAIRQYADGIFRKLISSNQQYAIATGLVLGIRSGLDNEIKQAYSSAGAMHVLAVSGAHVVIVFRLLAFLLSGIKRIKYGDLVFVGVILSLLWVYAFITGLSASVLRAVVIYSFIVIAQTANRQISMYNTLALSAFILLCYDPYLLLDVGFQLSYAAILGIVYLYPKLNLLLEFDNLLAKYVWTITCASFAAQVGTVPLSLVYFHQFPSYFLLANLAVIPLSSGVLYVGLATLVFSWIPYVSTALALLLKAIVWLLNQSVFLTEAIPGSLIEGISISTSESFLLYGLIISILLFAYYKKLVYWAITFLFVCLLSSIHIFKIYGRQRQQRLAIYSVANHTAISIIDNGFNYFMADSALLSNRQTIDFHISGHWRQLGIKKSTFINFYKPELGTLVPALKQLNEYNLLIWRGHTLLIVHKPINIREIIVALQPEYIIIQHNAFTNLPESNFSVKHLIIDGNNKTYITQRLKQQAQKKGIPCHSVKEEGAFILLQ